MEFLTSNAKRKVIRAGRRGGKTVGAAILAVESFLRGRRILYAAPTQDQVETFWWEVKRALKEPIDAGVFYKNETLHVIDLPNTKQRIRAKTAWNADTLRGDYADLLILDEYQLMNEDAWERVGAPMLLDNNGDAIFIYTPPSLHSRSVSKARDPLHAAKMYRRALQDKTGRWAAFHFSSHENPYISQEALAGLTEDMTELAIRQEIYAEDIEEIPGALWRYQLLEQLRVAEYPELVRIVVAVDPEAESHEQSAETGIIVAGIAANKHIYVLDDASLRGTPEQWGSAAVLAYYRYEADRIIGEVNNGGEMVGYVIRTIDPSVPFSAVRASRGKAIRAEPVAALYEQGKVHHVKIFSELEEQLCSWVPGNKSPDRLDALVWAITELAFFRRAARTGGIRALPRF